MTPKPKLVSQKGIAVLTLTQVKEQLKLPKSACDHDPELKRLMREALELVQSDTSYAVADSVWEWKPPWLGAQSLTNVSIPVPHFNPTSITSVTYTDTEGTEDVAVPTADYTLNLYVERPSLDGSFPAGSDFLVTYNAGPLTNMDVPEWFVQSCLSQIHWLWTGQHERQTELGRMGEAYEALTRRQYSSYL